MDSVAIAELHFGPMTTWSLRLLVWFIEIVLIDKRMLPGVDGEYLPSMSGVPSKPYTCSYLIKWVKEMRELAYNLEPHDYEDFVSGDEVFEISERTGLGHAFVFMVAEFILMISTHMKEWLLGEKIQMRPLEDAIANTIDKEELLRKRKAKTVKVLLQIFNEQYEDALELVVGLFWASN